MAGALIWVNSGKREFRRANAGFPGPVFQQEIALSPDHLRWNTDFARLVRSNTGARASDNGRLARFGPRLPRIAASSAARCRAGLQWMVAGSPANDVVGLAKRFLKNKLRGGPRRCTAMCQVSSIFRLPVGGVLRRDCAGVERGFPAAGGSHGADRVFRIAVVRNCRSGFRCASEGQLGWQGPCRAGKASRHAHDSADICRRPPASILHQETAQLLAAAGVPEFP